MTAKVLDFLAMKRKKKEMTVSELASMGGKARAAKLSADELSAISRKANRARTKKLTPERRSAIATNAIRTRWSKAKKAK